MPAIIGSCSTSSTIGILKAADPAKMPVFGLLVAGAAAYASRYLFSQPSDRPTTEALVRRIAADGHKNIAFLYINIAWGVGNVELVKEFASKYGLRVIANEALEPAATDLSVLVAKVSTIKPDAVLVITLGQSSAALARAFEAVGWHLPRYENALMPKIASKILGGYELFEGTTLFRQYDTRNPLCKKVLEDYRKRFGKSEEDMYMIGGYDAARTAIEAIRLAKDPNSGESIRDAAQGLVDIPSAMGRTGTRIKYAPDRHWFLGPDSFTLLTVKGGKLVYID